MKLYGYYRSTSSYRVRIALALKGLDYEHAPVNLLQGEHKAAAYLSLNPQGRVPVLDHAGRLVSQSPAILDYLEARFPAVALLSEHLDTRAAQHEIASIIACDIHPLHNVAVLNRLREMGHDEPTVLRWIGHWISEGLNAIEPKIAADGFCFGPQPSVADVYLIPQLYAAERFGVALDAYPRIRRVKERAALEEAFRIAHPDNQPDNPLRQAS